jgi:hypothetical protein
VDPGKCERLRVLVNSVSLCLSFLLLHLPFFLFLKVVVGSIRCLCLDVSCLCFSLPLVYVYIGALHRLIVGLGVSFLRQSQC